jgi:hypothetical protein
MVQGLGEETRRLSRADRPGVTMLLQRSRPRPERVQIG